MALRERQGEQPRRPDPDGLHGDGRDREHPQCPGDARDVSPAVSQDRMGRDEHGVPGPGPERRLQQGELQQAAELLRHAHDHRRRDDGDRLPDHARRKRGPRRVRLPGQVLHVDVVQPGEGRHARRVPGVRFGLPDRLQLGSGSGRPSRPESTRRSPASAFWTAGRGRTSRSGSPFPRTRTA